MTCCLVETDQECDWPLAQPLGSRQRLAHGVLLSSCFLWLSELAFRG